jgi:prepilin-type N-terminal cleavage/methylation domain-containing protein
MRNAQRGFSLLESLISLFLFLLIVLFCCDCFISVRNHFSKLKESETSNTAAYAALDRMRRDLLDAGLGLAQALELRILEGISEEQGALVVLSKSEELAVEEALAIGQQRIPTTDAKKVKRGQQIAIMNSTGGEVHIVASVDQNSFVIGSPLSSNYVQEDTNVVLLRIRRKINASPAQPLLEDVASFEFAYIRDANLVKLAVRLKIDEERKYETTVFPKNTGMASLFWEN